jgi:predicted RNase H-like HicB family nuclease
VSPAREPHRPIRGILAAELQYGIIPMSTHHLTAIIEREGSGYVALCPELDIASQGGSIEEAKANLQEALELFFETASPDEVHRRLPSEIYITSLEIAVG